ncbi:MULTISPECIES: hypothetical protein [Sphingobium]|uniref:hypothetical protein n=1 Tax=Sphingobium sp. MI1205 TaxID=407020 RepID=UPI000AB29357|nr:hypothetical protein [Sphingobium sp. MI1205]
MTTVRVIAWIVIAIMGANIANVLLNSGLHHGVGFDTFLAGSGDPWQLFINNDLVTGLLFMVSWMALREKGGRLLDTIAWIWMVMWWGNVVVAIYVLRAVSQANGDWQRFFLGGRAGVVAAAPVSAPGRALCGLGAILVSAWLMWSLQAASFAAIPTLGYVLGFLPIILSFALVAFPARPMPVSGGNHVHAEVR